jgi:hypothetical protein
MVFQSRPIVDILMPRLILRIARMPTLRLGLIAQARLALRLRLR